MESNKLSFSLGFLRLSMGLIFLWAFFDKVFGWGFATTAEKSWLTGRSPTTGFLQFGVHGPFANFFHSLAGNSLVDWLFMLGLLFVGVCLTFGVCKKAGIWSGIAILFLMYLAIGLPPVNHPFIDDHFIYILVLFVLLFSNSEKYLGFGNKWSNIDLIQKFPILK